MSEVIHAVEWGWQLEGTSLKPILTDQKPAPEDLLKVIRCSCKSASKNQCGIGSKCTCRVNGLLCVSACGDCRGDSCMNAEKVTIVNDSDASNSDSESSDDMQTSGELFADDDLPWNEEQEVILICSA